MSLALCAVVVAGCGPSVATTQQDAEVANAGNLGTLEAADHDAAQFGASLDEWADTVQETEPVEMPSATAAREEDLEPASEGEFTALEWDDLIPPGFSGPELMARYEDRLDAVEVGSEQASAIYQEMQSEFDPEAINPQLDGQMIRLAGFVAPLTYDEEVVTEFLLVPNFGACIHVPPPPPNQTIMVTLTKEDGLSIEDTWGPVWVEGTMAIESLSTELAPASYRIDSATSGVYDDF